MASTINVLFNFEFILLIPQISQWYVYDDIQKYSVSDHNSLGCTAYDIDKVQKQNSNAFICQIKKLVDT